LAVGTGGFDQAGREADGGPGGDKSGGHQDGSQDRSHGCDCAREGGRRYTTDRQRSGKPRPAPAAPVPNQSRSRLAGTLTVFDPSTISRVWATCPNATSSRVTRVPSGAVI